MQQNCLSGRTIIMKKLFNEVDVGQDHAAAAVPLKLQLVESVTE